MTVARVKRRGDGGDRTGSRTLSLLAVPLNAAVVRALADGPKSLPDLRRRAGSPAQTTMRAYLRELTRTGVVEKQRRNEFPGNVEFQLAASGRELLMVAETLSAWLALPPEGPTDLGGGGAKSAITALVGGWSTSIVRALAVRPLSLTELNSVISSVSYPSLERRLSAMRQAGLVEPVSSTDRTRPYALTEWMRGAVAPIVAAARWERRRFPDETVAITNRDAEAAFLLALPLLRLAGDRSGSCSLGVQIENGAAADVAGVIASVREGAVEAHGTRLHGNVDAWALGSARAWFAAVIGGNADHLEVGGDSGLAMNLVEGLHETLFGSCAQSR